ncbi:MAG: hypothetical protein M3H12_20885 [Chromatiales bacterium]
MGQGEGLNLKINEEPVELNIFMPDRVEEYWRKSSNQHWGESELIGQLTLNIFGKRPVRSRMQGVVGAGG